MMIIADVLIGFCLFVLFTSIMIDFVEARDRRAISKKNSFVETGSMTLFFIVFYAFIRFRVGEIVIQGLARTILMVLGLLLIMFGCYVNLRGRIVLGRNWANQVRIYENQYLVIKGIYKKIRHPLYASLIWMFYGACLVYPNYLAFLANTLIFIPMMFYRAEQEEQILKKTFKDYEKYQKEVGMFFPKLKK